MCLRPLGHLDPGVVVFLKFSPLINHVYEVRGSATFFLEMTAGAGALTHLGGNTLVTIRGRSGSPLLCRAWSGRGRGRGHRGGDPADREDIARELAECGRILAATG